MTLYQFTGLSRAEQQAAMEDAAFLAQRREGDGVFYLFQIDGFYVEVRCGLNLPPEKRMRTFFSTAPLEPYLAQMIIDL